MELQRHMSGYRSLLGLVVDPLGECGSTAQLVLSALLKPQTACTEGDRPFTISASRHHLPFLQGFKVNVSDPLVMQDSLGHALPGSVGVEGWGMVSLFGEMPAAPRKEGNRNRARREGFCVTILLHLCPCPDDGNDQRFS